MRSPFSATCNKPILLLAQCVAEIGEINALFFLLRITEEGVLVRPLFKGCGLLDIHKIDCGHLGDCMFDESLGCRMTPKQCP
jgi:hypothetical protein